MYNESGSVVLPSDITEEDKKFISYHESGHALINVILNNNRRIKEITISNNGSGTSKDIFPFGYSRIEKLSDNMKEKIEIETQKILRDCYSRAYKILEENKETSMRTAFNQII